MSPISPLAAPFGATPTAIPGVTNLQTIIGYTAWIATALCLIGLLAAGAAMAVEHQRGETIAMGRLGGVAAGCVIVGAAASIVGAVLGFNLFTSTAQAIPGVTALQNVINYVAWVAAAVCLIGLIVAGGVLALEYRRGSHEYGRLGGVISGCLVVGSAAAIVGALIP